MSERLKSVGSRVATRAKAAPSMASTMFALGATRWAAFGLRVVAVGLVSAGATALDASDSAPSAASAPAMIVAQVAPVADPAPGALQVTPAEAPAIEQQGPAKAAAPRTTLRAVAPVAPVTRADQPRKDSPEGENQVLKLIRRGYCLGSCRGSADGSDAAR
jgi:hypothetical protein